MPWGYKDASRHTKKAAKHEIQRRLKASANRSLGLFSTDGQIKASIKTVTDKFFSQARKAQMGAQVRAVAPSDPQAQPDPQPQP